MSPGMLAVVFDPDTVVGVCAVPLVYGVTV
jgi:hypothetical protein